MVDRSISTDSKVSNLQLNQINNNTQLSSPRTSSESPQESKRPSLQRRSSSKMSQQTLVLLYSKDPQGFGEVIFKHKHIYIYIYFIMIKLIKY